MVQIVFIMYRSCYSSLYPSIVCLCLSSFLIESNAERSSNSNNSSKRETAIEARMLMLLIVLLTYASTLEARQQILKSPKSGKLKFR